MGAAISKVKAELYRNAPSSRRKSSEASREKYPTTPQPPPPPPGVMGLHNFNLGQRIRLGTEIQVIEHKETQALYALTSIGISSQEEEDEIASFVTKRNTLERLDHPFIVTLAYSFQDAHHLHIVTDLVTGGTLQAHMEVCEYFSESVVRLWAAQLACAIHYMHAAHGLVHGNISASTVLLDKCGHAMVDGGAAQALLGAGAFAVDWYALGALMYRCVYGKQYHHPRRPSNGNGNGNGNDANANAQSVLWFPVVSQRVTHDCMSAIRGLLNTDPETSLGGHSADGMQRLRKHPFFATLDWELLEERQHLSLYVPNNVVGGIRSDSTETINTTYSGGGGGRRVRVPEFLDYNHAEYTGFKQCYFARDTMPEEVVLGGQHLGRNHSINSYMTPPQGVPIDPHTWGAMHPHQRALAIRYSCKLEKTHELYSAAAEMMEEDNTADMYSSCHDDNDYDAEDMESVFLSMYSLTSASLLSMTRGDAAGMPNNRSTIILTAPIKSATAAAVAAAAGGSVHQLADEKQKMNLLMKENNYQKSSQSLHVGQQQRYILTADGPRPLLASNVPRLKPIAAAEWNRPQNKAVEAVKEKESEQGVLRSKGLPVTARPAASAVAVLTQDASKAMTASFPSRGPSATVMMLMQQQQQKQQHQQHQQQNQRYPGNNNDKDNNDNDDDDEGWEIV
ncbi:Serine/threonine kinase [Coemansia sp. RSA 1804]|nr:Serine/threonine kinase [Coemansia sp. RSA 1804]